MCVGGWGGVGVGWWMGGGGVCGSGWMGVLHCWTHYHPTHLPIFDSDLHIKFCFCHLINYFDKKTSQSFMQQKKSSYSIMISNALD